MKKSLIALAVAGTVAVPAFAATSNVDVYGQIRMSVDSVDSDNAAIEQWNVVDRVSRIGFKGSEDLGGGMKAVWQLEQQLNATSSPLTGDSAFSATTRNTFVGLSGGFGTALVGRHDAPYKLGGSADVFVDTAGDAQSGGGIIGSGNFDLRVSGTIAYVSPTWSGFHFAAAIVPGEQQTGPDADGPMDAYSLVGVYANGPLKATLSYEDHDEMVDETGIKGHISYTFGDLTVAGTYEQQSDVGGTSGRDKDAYLVSVAYNMGPMTLKAQYGDRDDDLVGGDLEQATIGVDYALSKRTAVYALYNMAQAENAAGADVDTDTISFGINHSF